MCAPDAPPAPNYAAAAREQGIANRDAAIAGSMISNPNIYAPEGSQTITYRNDPVTGNPVPTVNRTYSPEYQEIFDKNTQLSGLLADLSLSSGNIASDVLQTPLDFDATLGSLGEGKQATIDSLMRRYDTDAGRRRDQINSDLVARGISPGTEAYTREMEMLDRQRNDAYNQATLSADERNLNDRRQSITELLAERQTPLNEISAFRTGSQINPISFTQNVSGQNVQPAPIFAGQQAQYGAALDQYNAEAGQYGNMMGGLFGLGSSYLGNPWIFS